MLGKRLKLVREEKHLSQKAFAEPLSTSSGYISEIEQGKKSPGSDFLATLSRAWNISIDWLLTGKGERYLSFENGDISDENIIEIDHVKIIKGFDDKEMARDANLDLRDIEARNHVRFRETCSYIKGVADTLRAQDSEHCQQGGDSIGGGTSQETGEGGAGAGQATGTGGLRGKNGK